MALKLTKARPRDLYVRMPLKFYADGDVVKDTDGEEGWIEFWHESAAACKEELKAYQGASVKAGVAWGNIDELPDEKVGDLTQKMNSIAIETYAVRIKDWRLVNDEGEVIDAAITKENAIAILSDEDTDLFSIAQEFLSKADFISASNANS